MTPWPSSDRDLSRALVLATIAVALVWSAVGAAAVVVPIGAVGPGVGWIGKWMHEFPAPGDDQ